MGYSKQKDNPRAVREHDEALANHERAWDEMHEVGQEFGHDSDEYRDARRTVVLLRDDITRARERVEARRSWTR